MEVAATLPELSEWTLPSNVQVLQEIRFCLKIDDAIKKQLTNRVTRSVLEIRSPHSSRTKKIGLLIS